MSKIKRRGLQIANIFIPDEKVRKIFRAENEAMEQLYEAMHLVV